MKTANICAAVMAGALALGLAGAGRADPACPTTP